MTVQRQVWFWLATVLVLLTLLILVRSILLPFVAGMAAAYFLDPAADRLEGWGLPRTLATALITLVFFLFIIVLFVLLFPVLQDQVLGFVGRLPAYIDRARELLIPLVDRLLIRFELGTMGDVREMALGFAENVVGGLGGALRGLWSRGLAIFNVLGLIFITPIVTFYLLRDWDHILARIDAIWPRHHAETVRRQLDLIDQAMAGFVRGQATVAATLGTIYGIGWSLAGLEFGLVIGLGTGVLAFVPYVGAAVGFLTALLVGFLQFGLEQPMPLGIIIGVFVAGQSLDASFLTPKLVGGRVGLHPVWVIFALLAGGTLFGFVGVLIAVPTAAAIGVMVRFAAEQYRASALYSHPDSDIGDDGDPGPQL